MDTRLVGFLMPDGMTFDEVGPTARHRRHRTAVREAQAAGGDGRLSAWLHAVRRPSPIATGASLDCCPSPA